MQHLFAYIRGRIILITALALPILFLFVLFYFFLISSPRDFPVGKRVVIAEGTPISRIAVFLEEESLIRSSSFFIFLSAHLSRDTLHSGTYVFEKPLNIFAVWYRIRNGVSEDTIKEVTFPEGSTAREMGLILKREIPDFDYELFTQMGKEREGYLFPDTYRFHSFVSPEEVIETLEAEFFEKIAPLEEEIKLSGRTLEEIVVMASLLEKEARLFETRQIVAGILWERIRIGMPLQVDAVFGYILDRPTFNPAFSDLEIESPYNTYQYTGLPPGAIANPGIDTIRAALTPIETPYLFYLTGYDGRMHYAETFEGHIANRRFLRPR